jgi:hypothetical protein
VVSKIPLACALLRQSTPAIVRSGSLLTVEHNISGNRMVPSEASVPLDYFSGHTTSKSKVYVCTVTVSVHFLGELSSRTQLNNFESKKCVHINFWHDVMPYTLVDLSLFTSSSG